jgi:hypothetical protein
LLAVVAEEMVIDRLAVVLVDTEQALALLAEAQVQSQA